MEINQNEEIAAGIPPLAGSRPQLHLVERMDQRQAAAASVNERVYPSVGGETNQRMLDAMTASKRVAVILARRGYSILKARVGSRNARLTIQAVPRCSALGGVEIRRMITNGSCERTMGVSIHGVQVEWTEWGR